LLLNPCLAHEKKKEGVWEIGFIDYPAEQHAEKVMPKTENIFNGI